jgi:hypothetical protein
LPTSITRTDLRLDMGGPEPPVLVEALGTAYFADAHLPGAINSRQGRSIGSRPSSSETSMRASSCTAPAGATAPAWSLVSSMVSTTPMFGSTRAARRTGRTAFQSTDQRTVPELTAR